MLFPLVVSLVVNLGTAVVFQTPKTNTHIKCHEWHNGSHSLMTGVLFGRTLPSTFQFIYDKHDSRPRDPFDVKWEVPFGEVGSACHVCKCAEVPITRLSKIAQYPIFPPHPLMGSYKILTL